MSHPLPPLPQGDRPILALVGPTASGKTALALEWAQALDTEIISADSVQIYQELDIGSAKPSPEELALVPHHAISVLSPTERPNAGAWVSLVTPQIERLHAQGKVPLIVGGTGLYVKALLEGLAEIPAIPEELRQTLADRLLREGPEVLHEELRQLDAEAAQRIAPRDSQRITRALEVVLATGTPISVFQREHTSKPNYQSLQVGLHPGDETLKARIWQRAGTMLEQGLLEEVSTLVARYGYDAAGLQTLGYREMVQALCQATLPPHHVLHERLAIGHRQYAKRQLTWFKRAPLDLRLS